MRNILLTAIIFLGIASSSCSFIVDFVVVNRSDVPVEVTYTVALNGHYYFSDDKPVLPESYIPVIVSEKKWEGGVKDDEWEIAADYRHRFGGDTARIKVKLLPGTVLRIARTSDRVLRDEGYEDFAVKELAVNGANGSAAYKDRQLWSELVGKDNPRHQISYK
jgi:hypothetical protein